MPKSHAQQAYGTIGCLWRESVHQYLREGEDAIPLNGVSHIQKDGQTCAPWLQQYGVESWTRQLFESCDYSFDSFTFLLAEELQLNPHGQNIILVHKQGY